MTEIIELDNKYIIKKSENSNINEKLLSLKSLKNVLKIDFLEILSKDYKEILKRLAHIKKKHMIGKKENDKILLGYVFNYDESNHEQKYFIKTMVFTPKEKILKRLLTL